MADQPPGDAPGRGAGRKGWQTGLRAAGPYMGTGLQLAGTVGVYVLLGWLADRWLDTEPWLLVAGGVLGMIAFFVQLGRLVGRMNEETRRKLEERRTSRNS